MAADAAGNVHRRHGEPAHPQGDEGERHNTTIAGNGGSDWRRRRAGNQRRSTSRSPWRWTQATSTCPTTETTDPKIATTGIIPTYAGSAPFGANFDGDNAKAATLAHLNPVRLAVDVRTTCIADTQNMRSEGDEEQRPHSHRRGSGGPSGYRGGLGGFSGDGGPATSALLSYPQRGGGRSSLNVYIADDCNQKIRKVTPGGTISTLAGGSAVGCKGAFGVDYTGDGVATAAHLSHPPG
jgi:hypothetical protein